MAYTLDFAFFGRTAGVTDWRAQLIDTTGANVGSAVGTGFVDVGNGFYQWHYAAIPDAHRGGVKFYRLADSIVLAVASINPEEAEYTDSKISAVAAAVWVAGSRTLTSFGSIVADVTAAVWGYVTRTLTITSAPSPASVQGTTLYLIKATTFGATLNGLTIPSTWSKLYFTVKASNQHSDDQAIIQIVKSNPAAGGDGLLRLNRVVATAAQGALTVDQPGGAATIAIADDATLQLNHDDYQYDLKVLLSDGSSTVLAQGVCQARLTSTHSV